MGSTSTPCRLKVDNLRCVVGTLIRPLVLLALFRYSHARAFFCFNFFAKRERPLCDKRDRFVYFLSRRSFRYVLLYLCYYASSTSTLMIFSNNFINKKRC